MIQKFDYESSYQREKDKIEQHMRFANSQIARMARLKDEKKAEKEVKFVSKIVICIERS